MYAHISVEAIGYDATRIPILGVHAWKLMPWVAEIEGLYSTGAFALKFLERQVRFDEANSKLSRGVVFHFYPRTCLHYEAFRRTSWGHSERYFFRVSESAEIVEESESEARAWAEKLDWERTCSMRP